MHSATIMVISAAAAGGGSRVRQGQQIDPLMVHLPPSLHSLNISFPSSPLTAPNYSGVIILFVQGCKLLQEHKKKHDSRATFHIKFRHPSTLLLCMDRIRRYDAMRATLLTPEDVLDRSVPLPPCPLSLLEISLSLAI